jgi:hypothetical protein
MGVATYAPAATRAGEELIYPDGRHELAESANLTGSSLYLDHLQLHRAVGRDGA